MGRVSRNEIMEYQSLPEPIYRTNDGRYFIRGTSNVHCKQCNENYMQPSSKLAKIIRCEKCGGINTISVEGKSIAEATIAANENTVSIVSKSDFFAPEDDIEVNKELFEKAKIEKNLPEFLRNCSFKKYTEIFGAQANLPVEQQLSVLQIAIERGIKQRLDYFLGMKKFKQIKQPTTKLDKTQEQYELVIANLNKEINGLRTELHTFREESNTNSKEIRDLNEIHNKQYLMIIEILERIYQKSQKKIKKKVVKK